MFKVKYVLILLCDLGVGASFRFIIIISISKLVPKRFALPVANVTNQMAQTRNLRCYLRYTIIDSAREDFFYKRKHTMSRNRRKMKMPLFFFFVFFVFVKLIIQTSYWTFRLRERFCRLCINSRNVPPICRMCDFEFEFECVRGILVRELPCVLPFFSFCVSELGDLAQQFREVFCTFFPPFPPTTNNVATSFDKKGFKTNIECGNPEKKVATCVVLSVARLALESHVECLNHDILQIFLRDDIVLKLANWILRSTSYGEDLGEVTCITESAYNSAAF